MKAAGQRFDRLPGHDDREFSLSNANATDVLKPGTMLVIDCGRVEGYIEQKLAKLSNFVNEGVEIGATHVGWG